MAGTNKGDLLTIETGDSGQERTYERATRALDSISFHLDAELDMPAFFGELSQTAAGLVHAKRAAFWRLDRNNVMSIQPEPFGFDTRRVLELRVSLQPDGVRIPEQVVFSDGVDRGRLNRKALLEYRRAVEFLGVRDAAAVSWRAGKMVLGGLAAYDSEAGFTEEDNWVLRIVARGAALVWQYKLAETELRTTVSILERTSESRKRLIGRLVRSTEEARLAFARDLHDESLQSLTAASLSLQRLRTRLLGAKDVRALSLADEVRDLVRSADSRLRRLLMGIRPPPLESPGSLKATVGDYAERLENEAGINLELKLEVPDDLPALTRHLVYRILQGALTNVEKHSGADSAKIGLRLEDHGVKGLVEDNGVGFELIGLEVKSGHVGLGSMQELAEMAGGWCRVESRPGLGTTVQFWVPLQ